MTAKKVDKWKKKMDNYRKTISHNEFKNDLKRAGYNVSDKKKK